VKRHAHNSHETETETETETEKDQRNALFWLSWRRTLRVKTVLQNHISTQAVWIHLSRISQRVHSAQIQASYDASQNSKSAHLRGVFRSSSVSVPSSAHNPKTKIQSVSREQPRITQTYRDDSLRQDLGCSRQRSGKNGTSQGTHQGCSPI
jgi:hypothetical protein